MFVATHSDWHAYIHVSTTNHTPRTNHSTNMHPYMCAGLSAEKAAQFVTDLETNNRYVQELWSV